MFILMKQRKGPNGQKRWLEVQDEEFANADSSALTSIAESRTAADPLFEYSVFEKIESPPSAP